MLDRKLINLILMLLVLVVLMFILPGTIMDAYDQMRNDRDQAIEGSDGERCVTTINPNYICENEYNRMDRYEQVSYEIVPGNFEDCEGHCYRPVS